MSTGFLLNSEMLAQRISGSKSRVHKNHQALQNAKPEVGSKILNKEF
jgi:hypothetical protein